MARKNVIKVSFPKKKKTYIKVLCIRNNKVANIGEYYFITIKKYSYSFLYLYDLNYKYLSAMTQESYDKYFAKLEEFRDERINEILNG